MPSADDMPLTPFQLACRDGDYDMAEKLLDVGVDVEFGESPV